MLPRLNMRRKFRGRAVPQKETAMDPTPVRFPGSYDERDRIRETHHVRINRLKLDLDPRHSYTI
jgi:hypothetical protein